MVTDQAQRGKANGSRSPAFHELLLSYRAMTNETREELAAAAGVSAKTIKAYERPATRLSARTPPADVFRRLCAHFREQGVLSPAAYAAFAAARASRRRRQGVPAPASVSHRAGRAARPALPRRLTELIGRDDLAGEVCALLQQQTVALVTLAGPGGIGKTHLALDVAARSRDAFPDGVWWVELAPVGSSDDVAASIAAQLGATDPPSLSPRERLLARLGEMQALLVLDNFEHLLDAAPLVSDLLSHCQHLTALVTSRTPLRLHGEQERSVPPLGREAASHLFVQRARDTLPTFADNGENAEAIDGICARLDDVPLALELAARQLRRYETPQALLAALTPALPRLVDGPRDAPERQQTMRAAIAWSYDLLSADAQRLLRRLAVCRGGCTPEAARALGQDLADVDACVAALIDHGLVQRATRARDARLSLFEVVREYGLEQLPATGEENDARRRHADYYLALAEEAASHYRTPEQARWDSTLVSEQDNLRAALEWAIRVREGPAALRLVVALWPHWERKGQVPEARRWLDGALAVAPATEAPDALRARSLYTAARIATAQNDGACAERWHADCRVLAERTGNQQLLGDVLNSWGALACTQADFGRAVSLHTQALAVCEAIGSVAGIADAHMYLGLAALLQWQPDDAETHYAQAGVLLRDLGDRHVYASARIGIALARTMAADWAGALDAYRESLTLARRLRDVDLLIYVLYGVAAVVGFTGEAAPSARLFGAGARLCEEYTVELPVSFRALAETGQGMVRGAMSEPEAFDGWYAEGQQLTLDDALALARRVVGDTRAQMRAG